MINGVTGTALHRRQRKPALSSGCRVLLSPVTVRRNLVLLRLTRQLLLPLQSYAPLPTCLASLRLISFHRHHRMVLHLSSLNWNGKERKRILQYCSRARTQHSGLHTGLGLSGTARQRKIANLAVENFAADNFFEVRNLTIP